jgi:photosystem II stability/assembly factor-like uncharacterized protein
MTDFETFSPEKEDDKNDQRLHQDLRRLFYVEGRDLDFFARLYTRLEERSASLPHKSGEPRHNNDPQPLPSPPPCSQGRRDFDSSGEKSWRQRLSTLVAAVVVAVLVGSLLVVLNQAHHTSSESPRHVLQAIGTLSSLHMIDTQVGWALTDKGHLLRTIDGGVHWHDVSPQALLRVPSEKITTNFLTGSLTWVAFPGSDEESTHILRTSDSGHTWQETTIPTTLVAQITFIDAQTGWLLSKHSVSESAETAELFHTGNGGKNWTRVATVLASSADLPVPGHLPFSGKKTGIRFLNETTGWITGSVPVNGSLLLYRTNDGGVTWSPQSLVLAPAERSAQLSITPPTFFTLTDGILPVRAETENGSHLNMYVTHDGGVSWQQTTPLMIGVTVSDFLDMKHGWASDGTHLYATGDGGLHWTQLSSHMNWHGLSHLDFVTSETGWAIGSVQTNDPSFLKTTDGGRTWTVIPWVIV